MWIFGMVISLLLTVLVTCGSPSPDPVAPVDFCIRTLRCTDGRILRYRRIVEKHLQSDLVELCVDTITYQEEMQYPRDVVQHHHVCIQLETRQTQCLEDYTQELGSSNEQCVIVK